MFDDISNYDIISLSTDVDNVHNMYTLEKYL